VGVLPLFLQGEDWTATWGALLGVPRGVLFFVANLTDQHLSVRIPHSGPGVTDLNELPARRLIHF